ncbi:phage major capsid protein [Listeria innocua]|uniref:Phage capsid protein n=1 Tax=Listeria welshimeri serovar 6b (strain ATCC 35897 / DSM 20650 / CCUG 15529 / CIP 8149 / NCTC 11857 / SLCC 5334 / V8) TaxID=386043 RepID=A0AI11_LISW6|nr:MULTISPECIES: phage major capsid protein [Listeria]EAC8096516.1 phage major capsid protein [Listeria monocytogenes]EAE5513097.1 phage major capsid protein [Listeria monocytogenes]EAE7347964.1 phage major capsid protein [Listeria monocytogenes]EAF7916533.1 phage major capsid protein [Listeria monocytogenes]EAG6120455.1 phage major capsid protein [Listeria monocytogenes]
MALKQLMIQKKLDSKRSDLEELETRSKTFKEREEELTRALEEAKTEEEVSTVEKSVDELESEKEKLEKERDELTAKIEELEKELEEANGETTSDDVEKGEGEERMGKYKDKELRSAVNTFIRTKGQTRAGLVSTDVGVVIPEEIIYSPEREVKTVTNLAELVSKTKVNTASGKYPILKRATSRLNSVTELTANPELAKPEFVQVNWEVETYRGAIPISQESIDDAAVDLVSIVSENAQEQKVNTTNYAISEVLKTFTAKTVANTDDIKQILNVTLDPAYERTAVVSQSFLQWVDTLKDSDGQYILHRDITSTSGTSLFGIKLEVVNDELLGLAGEAHAFLGDLKRAVLFADRTDITARWVDNEIYGQYLQVGTRFDVKKADSKAGYFLTFTKGA